MSGKRIIDSMKEALAISNKTLSADSYKVHIPASVDVKAIRMKMGLSQISFSARFGLSLHSLRNWEQGKRIPDPAARAYLKIIEKAPKVVAEALAD